MNTETLEKTEALKDYAKLLQDNGFRVIVSRKHPFEWMFFEKDGKLGTVSPDYFWGFDFATVNKPSHTHGTGYSIAQRADLTVENAQNCLVLVGWGSSEGVQKYTGAEDFIKNNQWADYYILPESEVA